MVRRLVGFKNVCRRFDICMFTNLKGGVFGGGPRDIIGLGTKARCYLREHTHIVK
jgi:hypothetical protein